MENPYPYPKNKLVIDFISDNVTDNFHRSQAHKALDWLVRNEPESAWEVIYQIVMTSTHEGLIGYVAAGPIEDLLVYHPQIINQIEKDALNNEKLCGALDGVWKNRMTDETWNRLKRIIDIQYKDISMQMQKLLLEQGFDVETDGFIGTKTLEAVEKLREVMRLDLESVEEIIEELQKRAKEARP